MAVYFTHIILLLKLSKLKHLIKLINTLFGQSLCGLFVVLSQAIQYLKGYLLTWNTCDLITTWDLSCNI